MTNILNNRKLTIYGDGKQSRDFVFIKDVVRSLLLALVKVDTKARVVNVCTGRATTMLKLVRIMKTITNTDIAIEFKAKHPFDISSSVGDPRLAEQFLSFIPEYDIHRGLREYCLSLA